jgi:DNA primase
MSLPPGFLDDLRTRASLSQVVGRKVMWDTRKSNQGKGDMWAPCPFHQEKSASFHVDDQKGFYYCFGCQAKGDAISFVRETENVGFMEAVRILADEVGMPMPAQDPKAQEKSDRRTQLAEVMEHAVKFFKLQLQTAAGADARAYLDGRGLKPPAQERWEIGFAPDTWQGLWDHLIAKEVDPELILGAGLGKPSQKGGKPYDTFRGRIMFPIRDARGRCTAFGGRAMDPNDNAKYLNSPETELFDKGRSLYNHGPARTAVGKGQPLIVSEGYMDVIALGEHGFGGAVAPLGTAITESQLQMMWRVSPEPIIALDGDKAGLRAAMRLIDLSLPLLEAGQSLRFALMPEGLDPDDLLKAQGAPGLQKIIDGAIPMVQLLWQRETEGMVFDSPERKAALDKTLREKIKLIKDTSIRGHYGQAIKDLRWDLFSTKRAGPQRRNGNYKGGGFRGGKWQPPQKALAATKSSALASALTPEITEHLREAIVLAALVGTPEVAEEFERGLESMTCRNSDHADIRRVILRSLGASVGELRENIYDALGPFALENLLNANHVAIIPCIRVPGDVEKVRLTVAEELGKLNAARGLDAEIADAAEDLTGVADEDVTYRLSQAAKAVQESVRSTEENKAEFDLGANGAKMDKDERSALDALMETIRYSKDDT